MVTVFYRIFGEDSYDGSDGLPNAFEAKLNADGTLKYLHIGIYIRFIRKHHSRIIELKLQKILKQTKRHLHSPGSAPAVPALEILWSNEALPLFHSKW